MDSHAEGCKRKGEYLQNSSTEENEGINSWQTSSTFMCFFSQNEAKGIREMKQDIEWHHKLELEKLSEESTDLREGAAAYRNIIS